MKLNKLAICIASMVYFYSTLYEVYVFYYNVQTLYEDNGYVCIAGSASMMLNFHSYFMLRSFESPIVHIGIIPFLGAVINYAALSFFFNKLNKENSAQQSDASGTMT